jgi:hypothetical protein
VKQKMPQGFNYWFPELDLNEPIYEDSGYAFNDNEAGTSGSPSCIVDHGPRCTADMYTGSWCQHSANSVCDEKPQEFTVCMAH